MRRDAVFIKHSHAIAHVVEGYAQFVLALAISSSGRAFSIAITACAAKFSSSAICLSENARHLLPIDAYTRRAEHRPFSSGTESVVRTPPTRPSSTVNNFPSPVNSSCIISEIWTGRLLR